MAAAISLAKMTTTTTASNAILPRPVVFRSDVGLPCLLPYPPAAVLLPAATAASSSLRVPPACTLCAAREPARDGRPPAPPRSSRVRPVSPTHRRMHVHRAGPLHPNQYHTLSQKTDPTPSLGALHLARTERTAAAATEAVAAAVAATAATATIPTVRTPADSVAAVSRLGIPLCSRPSSPLFPLSFIRRRACASDHAD